MYDTARIAYPSNPLTEIDKKFSRQLARVPCRVEPVFGVIENTMKSNTFRGIGFNPNDSYRIQKTSRTLAILRFLEVFVFHPMGETKKPGELLELSTIPPDFSK